MTNCPECGKPTRITHNIWWGTDCDHSGLYLGPETTSRMTLMELDVAYEAALLKTRWYRREFPAPEEL